MSTCEHCGKKRDIITVETFAGTVRPGVHWTRQHDVCHACAEAMINQYDVETIDGVELADVRGQEGDEWMAGVSLAERLADLQALEVAS